MDGKKVIPDKIVINEPYNVWHKCSHVNDSNSSKVVFPYK